MFRISDQVGTIATILPRIVAKGGDSFLLSSTFVGPLRSTRVCRAAILEVGSVTIAEPQLSDRYSHVFPPDRNGIWLGNVPNGGNTGVDARGARQSARCRRRRKGRLILHDTRTKAARPKDG
jgi:hypothetical protein